MRLIVNPPQEGRTMSNSNGKDFRSQASVCTQDTEEKPRDWLSQSGAMALAKRLERYWHDLGYPAARFWAEPIAERFAKVGTYELYRVACNLVNGLPPRYRD
jgi:hypothetical protein